MNNYSQTKIIKPDSNPLSLISFLIILFVLLITACTDNKPSINIAVASNFEPTLKLILEQYQKDEDFQINIIAGSSGVLASQINNNAPFDLFLSADSNKPLAIYRPDSHLFKPQVYAIGKLALWIPKSYDTNDCLSQLKNLNSLSIANPKTAPYGELANDIIQSKHLKINKIIHASNISQSYLYTMDNLTDAGFVAYSMLSESNTGCIQIFSDTKLKQSMLLLHRRAQQLYHFILSKKIQKLINNTGYNIANPES